METPTSVISQEHILYSLTAEFGNPGPWIETYTGRQFHFLAPELYLRSSPPSDIISDLARSLSCTTRFAGHCKYDWWVACHSVLLKRFVAQQLFTEEADNHDLLLACLLHDAHEFATNDVAFPYKAMRGPIPKAIEKNIQAAIYAHFDIYLSIEEEDILQQAECSVLKAEARKLMSSGGENWTWKFPNAVPANDGSLLKIRDYPTKEAKHIYLEELGKFIV